MSKEDLIHELNALDLITRSRRLRKLVFEYLRGDLSPGIPDGLAVIALRNNLKDMNQLDYFIQTQSPDGVWATSLELTLLAEIFQVNLCIRYKQHPGQETYLNADVSTDKPTVTICNDANVHWSAVVNDQETYTPGDGNCGYNAFALSLRNLSKTSANKVKQIEYTPRTDEIEQIESDYRVALSLALADLPGAGGNGSIEAQKNVIKQQAELLTFNNNRNLNTLSF